MRQLRDVVGTLLLFLLSLSAAMGVPSRSGPGQPPAPPRARKPDKVAGNATAVPPIEWMDWGPEAIRKAIVRDRPIVLNVVASWSRYCREMDATWADPRIESLIREGFVAIRVDADRRPDVRERYPNPTWPSVTLLLPNGLPFYAVREENQAPVRVAFGLMSPERLAPVLEEALALFKDKTKRGILRKTVEEGMKAEAEPRVGAAAIDPATPQKIFDTLRSNFDALHGSWTKTPKFLMSAPIEACLFEYSRNRDPRSLEIAERALNAITDGPLFDHVGGGIHRLAQAEDWSHPEYEKLLDRNVPLLDTLLSAYVLTGKQSYADNAAEIVRYLQTTLHRKGGGFFASQAFDPSSADGGAYYRAGLEERARMQQPTVDSLVLIGWSAKAAAAQLRAAALMQKRDWVGTARETLDWLLANGYEKGRGVVHGIDGDAKILHANFEDQVLFGEGMLESYELTGKKPYLKAAQDCVAFALENLRDPASGLFGDLIPNTNDPMIPFRTARYSYEWNSRMARLLARLYYLNPREKALKTGASGVLEAYANGYEKGPNSALYALAESEYREGPLWVWVIGNVTIPGYPGLIAKAQEVPDLWTMIVTLDPADNADARSITQLGLTYLKPPALYFTKGTHTSKGAMLVEEVLPTYRALANLLAEERAKAAERATVDGQSSGPAPGGAVPAPPPEPGKPAAPLATKPDGGTE